jgi:hypothetical protein
MPNIKIEELLNNLKEKGTTLKVMLDNFDPNNESELEFIKAIVASLNSDIDTDLEQIK